MAGIKSHEHLTAEDRLEARMRELGPKPLFVVYSVADWYVFEKSLGYAVSQKDIQTIFGALLHGKLKIRL